MTELGQIALNAALFFGALIGMEGVAWVSHKYIMHGPLWVLHKSHHQPPPDAVLERNDWFGVMFSLPSIALIYLGVNYSTPLLWLGLGIAGYGLIYLLFHDFLVHRRLKIFPEPKSGFLARIVEAHRIHHHITEKDGAVSFGFVYAPPIEDLRADLKRAKAAKAELKISGSKSTGG